MKNMIVFGLVLVLASCGQRAAPPSASAPLVLGAATTASGPISRACMAAPRKGKSKRLCGCIQAAADQTLSRSQQNRATRFYIDPHEAQEIRQSDRSADEAFWKAYVAYGERAERMCG